MLPCFKQKVKAAALEMMTFATEGSLNDPEALEQFWDKVDS